MLQAACSYCQSFGKSSVSTIVNIVHKLVNDGMRGLLSERSHKSGNIAKHSSTYREIVFYT